MITVGLDFGTHQSKVCIEHRKGAELSYEFFTFKDARGKERFTLPSIIYECSDGHLTYGYLPDDLRGGKIIRYFKQSTFSKSSSDMTLVDAVYYSIWYIAYILFDLEERHGQEFSIQMGVPSDGATHTEKKHLAVRILLSAYHLVEYVFENDKKAFLNTTVDELKSVTQILPYSKEKKEEFGLLVFPEAYVCLMPLVKSKKIARGMSLMVDIGGGTTDISFFTIKGDKPQVYKYYSIDKGLNFLTDATGVGDLRHDSNVKDGNEIIPSRKSEFTVAINNVCDRLTESLEKELRKQSDIPVQRLKDALKSRPLIYSGGGSTFKKLCRPHYEFRDIIRISDKEWRSESIKQMGKIVALGLCPILSTAYGLSISVVDDNINCEPFREIFKGIRQWTPEKKSKKNKFVFGASICSDGFSYADDWDAMK